MKLTNTFASILVLSAGSAQADHEGKTSGLTLLFPMGTLMSKSHKIKLIKSYAKLGVPIGYGNPFLETLRLKLTFKPQELKQAKICHYQLNQQNKKPLIQSYELKNFAAKSIYQVRKNIELHAVKYGASRLRIRIDCATDKAPIVFQREFKTRDFRRCQEKQNTVLNIATSGQITCQKTGNGFFSSLKGIQFDLKINGSQVKTEIFSTTRSQEQTKTLTTDRSKMVFSDIEVNTARFQIVSCRYRLKASHLEDDLSKRLVNLDSGKPSQKRVFAGFTLNLEEGSQGLQLSCFTFNRKKQQYNIYSSKELRITKKRR